MMTEKMFLSHIDDLALSGAKRGFSTSKFLTSAQLEMIKLRYQNRKDIFFTYFGGFENAERQIAIFSNEEYSKQNYKHKLPITALKLDHRVQDILTHRDVLGSVLALGIERDTIGDILIQAGQAYLVCLSVVSNYIMDNLQTAGKVGLAISEVQIDSLPEREEKYEIIQGTVPSLRLDAIVAFAFHLSRENAQQHIATGLVQLCHVQCTQPAKTVAEGSIISVRGHGRVRLIELGQLSKKGRQRVVMGRFI